MTMISLSFKISGVVGTQHAQVIKRLLETHPGVRKAHVSFEHKVADINFDPTKANPFDLVKVLYEVGCRVVRILP